MTAEPSSSLQTLIDVARGNQTLTRAEFEEIVENLETRKKYSVKSFNMLCTSADVAIVCDLDTEEFVQIETPMDAEPDDEVVVTRDL